MYAWKSKKNKRWSNPWKSNHLDIHSRVLHQILSRTAMTFSPFPNQHQPKLKEKILLPNSSCQEHNIHFLGVSTAKKKQTTKTPGFCWLFKTWNKLHMNNLNQVVSIQQEKHNIGCFLLSSPPGLSLLHHFCGLQFRVVGGQDLTITVLSLRTKGHR